MAASCTNVAIDDVLAKQPVSQDSHHLSASDSSNRTTPTPSSGNIPPTNPGTPKLVRGISLDTKTMKSMSLRQEGTSDELRIEALRIFKWLDRDCDDLLTLDDVRPLIEKGGAEAWFDYIDEAGTGTLTEDEFVKGFSALISSSRRATPKSQFSSVGSLAFKIKTRSFRSYESFSFSKSWKKYMEKSQHDNAMKTFQQIDSNRDGTLTLDEVKVAAPKLSLSEEEAVSWFAELDIDGSGTISAHEFELKYKASSTFHTLIGALHDAVGSAADYATHFIEEENRIMHKTFSAAEELGRGALARAFKGHQINALALRLLRGHKVYSRNWKSDLWLHLKNKQIFLSLFCVHPDHPFSKRERISALAVSFLLAWGLEFWFCALWTSCDTHPDLNFFELFIHVLLLKIAVSAITNGIYDVVLEQAMTCACVQEGCPPYIQECCELLSIVALLIQTAGGVVIIMLGWLALSGALENTWFDVPGRANDTSHMISYTTITIRELVIGKFFGLFVVTMLIECIGFLVDRKAQLKPSKNDVAAREIWNHPKDGCCGHKGRPPNHLWNRFIGEDSEFEDLPNFAPTYDFDVYFFHWIVYRERAAEPQKIPKYFVDETFLAAEKEGSKHAVKRAASVFLRRAPSRVQPDPEIGNVSEDRGTDAAPTDSSINGVVFSTINNELRKPKVFREEFQL